MNQGIIPKNVICRKFSGTELVLLLFALLLVLKTHTSFRCALVNHGPTLPKFLVAICVFHRIARFEPQGFDRFKDIQSTSALFQF